MKVYYNSSLWDKSKGIPGRSQKINWEFEENGLRRIIPTIYHFSKGIVFDLITIIDEGEFRRFYDKYKNIEEDLEPLEQCIVEQEHPYQTMDIKEIWINGIKVEEGHSSSGSLYISWLEGQDELAVVKEAYSHILKNTSCFGCSRYLVPYPKKHHKIGEKLGLFHLSKIDEIKLITYPIKKLYPLDINFEMSVEENLKEISFLYTTTGIEHKLYFQNNKIIDISNSIGENHKLHIMQSMYEIEPALPKGSNLQFGSSIQYSGMSIKDRDSNSASSIGIIGGADGPTAIFISGKEKDINYGQNGLPLHTSLSVPSLEKQNIFKFVLEGINIEVCGSREYEFRL